MKNQFTLNINIKEVKRSNLLLRAFWSKIREVYGSCGWEFSPITNRQNRTIIFGRFSTKNIIKDATEVQIKYENRGGIKTITFTNSQSDISHLKDCQFVAKKKLDKIINIAVKIFIQFPKESRHYYKKFSQKKEKNIMLKDYMVCIQIGLNFCILESIFQIKHM